jgi:hypothetical protein
MTWDIEHVGMEYRYYFLNVVFRELILKMVANILRLIYQKPQTIKQRGIYQMKPIKTTQPEKSLNDNRMAPNSNRKGVNIRSNPI